MSSLVIEVKGKKLAVAAPRDTPLLYVLRNRLSSARAALRLGSGAARCLHRHARRPADPFLCGAAGRDRTAHHDRRGTWNTQETAATADGDHSEAGSAVWILLERDVDGFGVVERRGVPGEATGPLNQTPPAS